jgi:hypothetical protein
MNTPILLPVLAVATSFFPVSAQQDSYFFGWESGTWDSGAAIPPLPTYSINNISDVTAFISDKVTSSLVPLLTIWMEDESGSPNSVAFDSRVLENPPKLIVTTDTVFPDELNRWYGWDADSSGDVDTGSFLGWIYPLDQFLW